MKMNIKKNNSGIALILVLGVLAVLVILATTFAFNMRLEQKAASNYLDAVKAESIAELGINHAIAVLRNDATAGDASCQGYDWYDDNWGFNPGGTGGSHPFAATGADDDDHNIDNDSNSSTYTKDFTPGRDSCWIDVTSGIETIGRYAVLILDESGRMNINYAGNIYDSGSFNKDEGWTTWEIDLEKLSGIDSTLAKNIVKYRYGLNEKPGASGDDEGDSNTLAYDGIDNTGDGQGTGAVVPDEGVEEPDEFTPWFPRGDDCPFVTTEQLKLVSGITTSIWNSIKNSVTTNSRDRNKYYSSSTWNDKISLNAVASVDDLYTVLDGLGIEDLAQKVCNIFDYRDDNYILSTITKASTTFYGVEPILINEVLCKSHDVDSTSHSFSDPPGGGSWSNSYSGLAPNTCYRITINRGAVPDDGDFDATIGLSTETVNSNPYNFAQATPAHLVDCVSDNTGQITIDFQDIIDAHPSKVISVEFVCAEAIELYNISEDDIDISGWDIDPGDGNFDAIPVGKIFPSTTTTTISAGGSFILTNDEELFARSYGDGDATWGEDSSETTPVAVMGWLSGYSTDGELTESGNMDILIRNGDDHFTERVDSNTGRCSGGTATAGIIGVSRERDDPTVRSDWADNTKAVVQASLLYKNTRATGHTYDEVYINSYPIASIGSITETTATPLYQGVSSGSAWTPIPTGDLEKIADRIMIDAVKLDAEVVGSETGDWVPRTGEPYSFTNSYRADTDGHVSTWTWSNARLDLNNLRCSYQLYVYGKYTGDSSDINVTIDPGGSSEQTYSGLAYDRSDGIGVCTITHNHIESDGSFKIKLTRNNASHNVYFDYLLLVPDTAHGRVNVNTALPQVLEALPWLSVAKATALYNSVHASPEVPYRGLRYILADASIDADDFAPISNLVTVHSDIFRIICTAQALDPIGEVTAEKKVEVIVDRSSLPIKILSWKEITE